MVIVPKPAARLLSSRSVPAASVMPPVWPAAVKVGLGPKVSVPVPVLVKLAAPLSVPVSVRLFAPTTSIWLPATAAVIVRAVAKVPVACSVPPLSWIDAPAAPKLASALTESVP